MSRIIDLGCRVADVHHRYQEIHGALFGAASFRLVIDALRGRRRHAYAAFSGTLKGLQDELAELDKQVAELGQVETSKAIEHELQQVLLEYLRALSKAIVGLDRIFVNLEQDEAAYRDTGTDGRSRFTHDKLHYDHVLSELERLGTRLNRLFSHY